MRILKLFPHQTSSNKNSSNMLKKLIIAAIFLISLTTQQVITEIPTKITNPTMMDACRDGQTLILANKGQIQIIKLNETGIFQVSYEFSWQINIVKCLRENVFAIALSNLFCILEKGSEMKCSIYFGKPFSISQEVSDKSIYLFVKHSQYEYEQIIYKNGKFTQSSIAIDSQQYNLGEYVGDHNYIYLPSEQDLGNINYWKTPFKYSQKQSITIQRAYPIKSMITLLGTDSILISNNNGDFGLIKSNQFITDWTETQYSKGCLCTKQKVVLSNGNRLTIYNYDEIKIYEGFEVKGDLVEVECVNREEDFKIFLLGSQDNLILIDFKKDESGMTFYVILFLLLVVGAVACKSLLFNNKEQPRALSETDGNGNYQELKDTIKNEGSEGQTKQ